MMNPTGFALLLFVTLTSAARAQSVRVVNAGDSALLIVSPLSCATHCPDSARIEWRYGGTLITRKVQRGVTDTARFARNSSTSAYTDSARVEITPFPFVKNVSLVAFVAPLATTAATSSAPASIGAGASTTGASTTGASTTGATNPAAASAASTAPQNRPDPSVPVYISAPVTGSFVQPTPPATFSTSYPGMTGKSRRVAAGQDLQAALNSAQPGEEIILANGATFTGNYILPVKSGSGWVIIRGETTLGPSNVRVDPKQLTGSAIVVTNNSMPAFVTAPGATRWRLVGFQITHATGAAYNYGIVVLGRGDEKALGQMPTDIVLDRMWVRGSTTDGNSRCVAFNGTRLAVVHSWLTECHAKGFDAQGVGGWGGPGPYLIEDNRIEASGQGVMFGGADPSIQNVSPSDIIVRRNYIYKPLSWGRGRWTVKAAFELKHARRVLFEGNVIENHWADAQTGFAILFQTLANNNRAWSWTTVQDVLVQNNLVRNSTSGVNILARVAYDGGKLPTNPTSRVAVINNVFENVGRDPISNEGGILLQLLSDLADVTFAQNTMTLSTGRAQKSMSFDGPPGRRTTIIDNVFPQANYPMTGNSTASGIPTLNAFMPGGTFRGNEVPGQQNKDYPPGGLAPHARGANRALIDQATAGVVK